MYVKNIINEKKKISTGLVENIIFYQEFFPNNLKSNIADIQSILLFPSFSTICRLIIILL